MSSSMLMVSLATMVAAHNWINSPSRTSLDHSSASTVVPGIPAQSDEPHVVVRAGQPFPVEWSCGHGSDVIFTIVAANNFDKLTVITDKSTQAFFKDNTTCPQVPPPPKFMNYHQKYNDMTLDFDGVAGTDGIVPPPSPDFFKRLVPKTDPNYIPRHPLFKKSFKNLPNTNSTNLALISQFEYKDTDTVNNRRCHPITPNAKMPWVVAMFRYRIVRHQPSRPDVALLDVPVGTPAGDYVVHYYWRGYTDAFDLRVVAGTTDIANPYGLAAPVGVAPVIRFKRFDHCSFPTMRSFGTCFPMSANDTSLPSPQQCIDLCKTKTFAQCDAVAVVPLQNPTSVNPVFRDIVNVRFNTNTCIKPTDPAVTHMCYTLVQSEPTQTENAFFLAEDTEDPAFYSTCYLRIDSFDREGLVPASTRPLLVADKPKFRAGGRCVACDDRTAFTRVSVTPVWQLANSCVNCDVPASSQ